MKLVCIKNYIESGGPNVYKGKVYTAIESKTFKTKITETDTQIIKELGGIYYLLIECDHWYHNSLFVKIDDDQPDEITMKRHKENVAD